MDLEQSELHNKELNMYYKIGIVLVIIALTGGLYWQNQMLKADNATLEHNIGVQKVRTKTVAQKAGFDAESKTAKKYIEKGMNREESNTNNIDSTKYYLKY